MLGTTLYVSHHDFIFIVPQLFTCVMMFHRNCFCKVQNSFQSHFGFGTSFNLVPCRIRYHVSYSNLLALTTYSLQCQIVLAQYILLYHLYFGTVENLVPHYGTVLCHIDFGTVLSFGPH